jgi:hypothetical protein
MMNLVLELFSPRGNKPVEERSAELKLWDAFFDHPSQRPFGQKTWSLYKDAIIYEDKDHRIKAALASLKKECTQKGIVLQKLGAEIHQEFEICNQRLIEHATKVFMRVVLKNFQEHSQVKGIKKVKDADQLIAAINQDPAMIAKVEELDLELDMLEEGIEYLPPEFTSLPFPALTTLHLETGADSKKKLFVLPPPDKFFLKSPIEYLNLSNNGLRSWDPQMGTAWKIKELDLSGNKLTALPAFGSQWPVEQAYFKGNRIAVIDKAFGQGWNACQRLGLSENPFDKRAVIRIIEENLPANCKVVMDEPPVSEF